MNASGLILALAKHIQESGEDPRVMFWGDDMCHVVVDMIYKDCGDLIIDNVDLDRARSRVDEGPDVSKKAWEYIAERSKKEQGL